MGEKKERKSATSEVFSASWSPDGNLVAQLDEVHVQVWDLKSRQKVRTLPGMYSPVAWRPGSKELATVPQGKVIKVWDALTGRETLTLRGHRDKVTSLTWSPDGKRLASTSKDLVIEVWDTQEFQQGSLLAAPTLAIGFISPDGRRFAGVWDARTPDGKAKRDLKAWDLTTRKELLSLRGLDGEIMASWSPDGERLACAEKTHVTIWDISTGRWILKLPHPTPVNVREPAWSPDGRKLATVEQHSIKVWDLATGKEIPHFRLPATYRHHDNVPYGLWTTAAWSPNGKWLACTGLSAVIRIWDAETGEEALPLAGHDDNTRSLEWSPDSVWLISSGGHKYGSGKLWHFPTRRQVFELPGAELGAWSPDSRRFLFRSNEEPSVVRVWDRSTLREVHILRQAAGTRIRFGPRWSRDGRRLTCCAGEFNSGPLMAYSWDATAAYEGAAALTVPEASPQELDGRALVLMGTGNALRDSARPAEAQTAYSQALDLQQELVKQYPGYSAFRQTLARIHLNMGVLFRELGQPQEAEKSLLQALSLKEDLADELPGTGDDRSAVHYELGHVLQQMRRFREAAEQYRQFSKLRSSSSKTMSRNNVAWFLATCEDAGARDPALAVQIAAVAYGRALIIFPGSKFLGDVCNTFGVALYRAGFSKFAIAVLEHSIQIRNGGDSSDFFFLAMAHCRQGDMEQARRDYDKAVQWMDNNKPQDQELLRFRTEATEVLSSSVSVPKRPPPAKVGELLPLARFCHEQRGMYHTALGHYMEAFARQPKVADDLRHPHRYNAACAAALAGCGQGKDADQADNKERARLRKQALKWLRGDLAAWRQMLEKQPDKARTVVQQGMQHLLSDKDFHGVRGPEALAKLPADERQD
jgi:WD40 repeat protein/tetratricopeptide (TPR) repeat protein